MKALPWILLAAALVFIVFLLFKLYLIRKSADEIATAFSDRLTHDTNTRLDISSRDSHMLHLTSELNEQLRETREQRLRYRLGDAELKDAITNVSHDLRTPLTALFGYLELIKNEPMSEDAARCLAMISNRAEALKSLTEELFKYSVLVSNDELETESVNIGSALEESLVSFYGTFTQNGIEPVIDITETRVERSVNRSALSRVFDNIISNALKYSDGDFFVSMDSSGKIVFSNTAKGLDAVSVGRLFDRFYTVETGKSSTGLGLSIARLLTERMRGSIRAEYNENKLSIVVIF